MKRIAWWTGAGVAAALAVGLPAGCSSSSSGNGSPGDSGAAQDVTTADTGVDSGVAADSSVDTGPVVDSGSPEDASDGATCAAASAFFQNPARAACTGAHCCADLGACLSASGCVAIFQCFVACVNQNGGGPGALTPCAQTCSADAAGAQEFLAAQSCVFANCASLWFPDAGATDAATD